MSCCKKVLGVDTAAPTFAVSGLDECRIAACRAVIHGYNPTCGDSSAVCALIVGSGRAFAHNRMAHVHNARIYGTTPGLATGDSRTSADGRMRQKHSATRENATALGIDQSIVRVVVTSAERQVLDGQVGLLGSGLVK